MSDDKEMTKLGVKCDHSEHKKIQSEMEKRGSASAQCPHCGKYFNRPQPKREQKDE